MHAPGLGIAGNNALAVLVLQPLEHSLALLSLLVPEGYIYIFRGYLTLPTQSPKRHPLINF